MKADLDQLVIDCRATLGDTKARAALREVLERAVSRPADLMEALPAPSQQGVVVHVSDDLTILQVVNGRASPSTRTTTASGAHVRSTAGGSETPSTVAPREASSRRAARSTARATS